VDEAGRGSWLGPLVVGAFAVDTHRLSELASLGARDSKELSPAERERVYARLLGFGRAASVELDPAEIDRHVAFGRLNELEAETFGTLLRPLAPAVAYVDACDVNEKRFGRRVAARAGAEVRVISRHHADRTYPVVGAASIVAKVRRDRRIAELARALGRPIGSGYPSDPATIDAVRALVRSGSDRPGWLRASWKTTTRVLPLRPPRRNAEGLG
jgi:ribonuclease HII